ncbi:MAG: DNA polymerase IV, partial [Christensenellales bacterium]
MERRIIHLNIADFSVAVERLLDTSLKGKALIIAHPSPRAVVADMSDEAYAEGVHKGMLLSTARLRCRKAL